jgi:DNA-binding MarR family transcriptional regulator
LDERLDPRKLLVDRVDEYQPLGRYLVLLFRLFEDDLVERLRVAGYKNVSPADLNVLRFVRPTGSTSVEIAKLAGVSKQAIAKSIAGIEAKGYLKRQSHPEDGRSQVVLFTPRGRRLLESCIFAIAEIEQIYERAVGKEEFLKVKLALARLIGIYDSQR